jgi:hypothetical protein
MNDPQNQGQTIPGDERVVTAGFDEIQANREEISPRRHGGHGEERKSATDKRRWTQIKILLRPLFI